MCIRDRPDTSKLEKLNRELEKSEKKLRKASGAQKRYEDKIKKRKKAEIEAKKAAIRAEDIAKGVFVPVSSLPDVYKRQAYPHLPGKENFTYTAYM